MLEFFTIVCVSDPFEIKDEFATGEKRIAGDFMFDPAGLRPKTQADLESMQAKEINNGRLAMIGLFGFLSESTVPGSVPFLKGIIPAYTGEVMAPFAKNIFSYADMALPK